jgi:uncharacterized delta-60 repeat protein
MVGQIISRSRLVAMLALVIGASSFTHAQNAGALDPAFGNQGRTIKTIPNSDTQNQPYNAPEDMVIQPDGKIVVAGYFNNGNNIFDFFVVRFNPDGTVDTSFASNGIFRYDYQGGSDECYGVALQADGRIVIVGSVQINPFNPEPNTAWAVIRLTPGGTLDSSFGNNGVVITDHMLSLDEATEVAIQPDQRILVSGWSNRANTNIVAYDFAVVRYLPNGAIDTTWGNSGFTYTDFNGRGDLAHASVLQPDGKLVVAGNANIEQGEDYDFAVARYNPNGTLDTAFDGDGRVTTRFLVPGSNELGRGAALAPDGKIIVTGEINYPIIPGPGSHSDVATARYLPNGALDPTFSGDGRFIYDSNLSDRNENSYDVVVQPDGKPVLLGKSRLIQETIPGIGSVGHVDFLLIRLDVAGNLDPAFAGGGVTRTDFGIFNPPPLGSTRTGDRGRALALQRDGKIVAAGLAAGISNSSSPRPMHRGGGDPSPDGSLDGRLVLARYQNDVAFGARAFDFDGDGRADISVYRNGAWHLLGSTGGYTVQQFGVASDRLVAADYDGDGRTDLAVFRDGVWHIMRSTSGYTAIQFGVAGDIPQVGDYDGDGRADLAVFRPSDRTWYRQQSTAGFAATQFGVSDDVPVAADYDGDGKTDIAVFRPSTSVWHLLRSRDGYTSRQYGISTDRPVPGDYDGDNKADLAVYRNGTWWILRSTTNSDLTLQFGVASDRPVAADYDGDGRTDLAVYRNGEWHILRSTAGYTVYQFGLASDVPVPMRTQP